MEGIAFPETANVSEEDGTFLVPRFEVGRSLFLIGAAREDQVGDGEIAHGTIVGRGFGIQLAGDTEGGFAEFPTRSGIAGDGGIKLILVNDDSVVANRGSVFILVAPAEEGERDDNERIGLGDQIAARLQIGDARLVFLDLFAEETVALNAQPGKGELLLVFPELGLPSLEEGIGRFRLLRPAIAGEGLVKLRHRDVIIELGPAIPV